VATARFRAKAWLIGHPLLLYLPVVFKVALVNEGPMRQGLLDWQVAACVQDRSSGRGVDWIGFSKLISLMRGARIRAAKNQRDRSAPNKRMADNRHVNVRGIDWANWWIHLINNIFPNGRSTGHNIFLLRGAPHGTTNEEQETLPPDLPIVARPRTYTSTLPWPWKALKIDSFGEPNKITYCGRVLQCIFYYLILAFHEIDL
jgi:hypothetical protein